MIWPTIAGPSSHFFSLDWISHSRRIFYSLSLYYLVRISCFLSIHQAANNMDTERKFSTSGRRKSVGEEPVTSVLPRGEVPMFDRELTADEEVLAALGYKPEFKREFSLWTSFCVSFAVLGLLPSFASTLYYVCHPYPTLLQMALTKLRRRAWDMQVHRGWCGAG